MVCFKAPPTHRVLATHESRTGLGLKEGSVGDRKYFGGKCVPEKFGVGGCVAF